MASTETADLLRRLGALDADDVLTNGAALLFTARAGRALVDYRRREVPGGDFVRRHQQIRTSDYAELFGVSKAHAARVLRELASPERGEILRPGRTPNVGRDAHYLAGPGFPSVGHGSLSD